ncbi:hypothetical protein HGM15179_009192 [Zosterops borbonicus]|uniref:Uncharacterized protein n=1 Tax=Zosterops borbonicus TaxID=364589 RepID=A0A8K1GGB5_9PASS|nr:hypothetical protein HGM15179_009192 [Zosterops borbonicus]
MSRGADETPDPGVENPEWCGGMGGYGPNLKEFSDPKALNSLPEHTQNPAEVGKYLKEKCNDNSNGKNLIARSWFLVYAYRTLLDTIEQQIKAKGQEDRYTVRR